MQLHTSEHSHTETPSPTGNSSQEVQESRAGDTTGPKCRPFLHRLHPLAPLALLFPTQIASKRNRLHLGQLPRRPGCISRTTGRICGRSHGHVHNPSITSPAAQEGELGTKVLETATPDCHRDLAACQHPNLHTPPYSVWEMGSEGPEL